MDRPLPDWRGQVEGQPAISMEEGQSHRCWCCIRGMSSVFVHAETHGTEQKDHDEEGGEKELEKSAEWFRGSILPRSLRLVLRWKSPGFCRGSS